MSCVCPSPLRLALATFCSVVAVLACLLAMAVVRSLTQVIERATAAVMIIVRGVFDLETNKTEIHLTTSALTASYTLAWTL